MSKHIITTDNQDQKWLDSFNHYVGYSYKMNQEINEEHLDSVKYDVIRFNHELALGPAIILKESEE